MIHTTIGVYPNGDYKSNGVRSENIAAHIWYNITFRPGRTLYVDGILIHRGSGFTDELMNLWGSDVDGHDFGNGEFKGKASTIKIEHDTAPYV